MVDDFHRTFAVQRFAIATGPKANNQNNNKEKQTNGSLAVTFLSILTQTTATLSISRNTSQHTQIHKRGDFPDYELRMAKQKYKN